MGGVHFVMNIDYGRFGGFTFDSSLYSSVKTKRAPEDRFFLDNP